MPHTAHIILSKAQMDKVGIRIIEEVSEFIIEFKQSEDKSDAICDAGANLVAAGFRASSVDEFLNDLVSFENALMLMKMR